MAAMEHPTVTRKGKKDNPITKRRNRINERRKNPRVYFKLPLSYSRIDSKDNHGGIVGNASEGGILVYLSKELNTGEILKIEILFAKGWELKTVQGIAKIVWSDLAIRKSRRVHRYGLQFQFFNQRNLQKLRILLKEASKKE
ncbi:MAG: hypothetical protein A2156_13505 [Deltaproteobacteria bacterium RBG_16_48_10]|nr:MAG: hypothetical protein A2156_13505 [Deltaproteobacteria bacterium RBG_16_48_10]